MNDLDGEYQDDIIDEPRKPYKKIKVGLLMPMTSKNQTWTDIGDCAFLQHFLPNFLRCYEPDLFDYTIYIGLDKDDQYFVSNVKKLKQRLRDHDKIFIKDGYQGKVTHYWNFLMDKAYKDGQEYFIQYGDDIEMKTQNFTSYYITILKNNNDFGLIGGVDFPYWIERQMLNKVGILENFCCSRKHYEMLGYMFNPAFPTWWSDDVTSGTYYNLCFTCPNIKFKNANRVGTSNPKSRYKPNPKDEQNVEKAIEQDQRKIYNYITKNKLISQFNPSFFRYLHSKFGGK